MKIKKYNQLFEAWFDRAEHYYDPFDDDDDDDDDKKPRSKYDYDDYSASDNYDDGDDSVDDVDDLEGDENMQHLLYLLRTMFTNSGIDAEVSHSGLDITVEVYLSKQENLKDVIRVFEIGKKLKKDILAQYDSEVELWETKKGDPMITFTFIYGDGLGDDNSPF